jgi:hypothetical protein
METRDILSYILAAAGILFLGYGAWTQGWRHALISVAVLVAVLVWYRRQAK